MTRDDLRHATEVLHASDHPTSPGQGMACAASGVSGLSHAELAEVFDGGDRPVYVAHIVIRI